MGNTAPPLCGCGAPAYLHVDLGAFQFTSIDHIDACLECVKGRWREHIHHAISVGYKLPLYQPDGTFGDNVFPREICFCRYRQPRYQEDTASIVTGPGPREIITVQAQEGLGLYKKNVHNWVIVHINSGGFVATGIRAKWRAMKCIGHLLPILDWREDEEFILSKIISDPDLALLLALVTERAMSRTLGHRSMGRRKKRKGRPLKQRKKKRVKLVRGVRYEKWIEEHGIILKPKEGK